MGTFIGHVAPGVAFLLLGIWHMYNTIKFYSKAPWSFQTRPWYAIGEGRFLKHGELVLVAAAASLSIVSELFICPKRHQPLDDNWSIPNNHLQNFEHSSMSLFFLIYAVVALVASCLRMSLAIEKSGFLHLLGAIAFSQEWLLFHFHSADHMGLEGHYHWLLQLAISVCVAASVAEAAAQSSLLPPLVRSAATMIQGMWLVVMGMVLWLPPLTPRGCALVDRDMHRVVACIDHDDEHRAKALANLQFNWCIAIIIMAIAVAFMVAMRHHGSGAATYLPLARPTKFELAEEEDGAENGDLEKASNGSHGSIDFSSSMLR